LLEGFQGFGVLGIFNRADQVSIVAQFLLLRFREVYNNVRLNP